MGHRSRFIPKSILGIALASSALIVGASHTASTAQAQTDTARIAGTVQDPTGATIPGATVVVTNKQQEISIH